MDIFANWTNTHVLIVGDDTIASLCKKEMILPKMTNIPNFTIVKADSMTAMEEKIAEEMRKKFYHLLFACISYKEFISISHSKIELKENKNEILSIVKRTIKQFKENYFGTILLWILPSPPEVMKLTFSAASYSNGYPPYQLYNMEHKFYDAVENLFDKVTRDSIIHLYYFKLNDLFFPSKSKQTEDFVICDYARNRTVDGIIFNEKVCVRFWKKMHNLTKWINKVYFANEKVKAIKYTKDCLHPYHIATNFGKWIPADQIIEYNDSEFDENEKTADTPLKPTKKKLKKPKAKMPMRSLSPATSIEQLQEQHNFICSQYTNNPESHPEYYKTKAKWVNEMMALGYDPTSEEKQMQFQAFWNNTLDDILQKEWEAKKMEFMEKKIIESNDASHMPYTSKQSSNLSATSTSISDSQNITQPLLSSTNIRQKYDYNTMDNTQQSQTASASSYLNQSPYSAPPPTHLHKPVKPLFHGTGTPPQHTPLQRPPPQRPPPQCPPQRPPLQHPPLQRPPPQRPPPQHPPPQHTPPQHPLPIQHPPPQHLPPQQLPPQNPPLSLFPTSLAPSPFLSTLSVAHQDSAPHYSATATTSYLPPSKSLPSTTSIPYSSSQPLVSQSSTENIVEVLEILKELSHNFDSLASPMVDLHKISLNALIEGRDPVECIDDDAMILLGMVKSKLSSSLKDPSLSVVQKAVRQEAHERLDAVISSIKKSKGQKQQHVAISGATAKFGIDLQSIAMATLGRSIPETIDSIKNALVQQKKFDTTIEKLKEIFEEVQRLRQGL